MLQVIRTGICVLGLAAYVLPQSNAVPPAPASVEWLLDDAIDQGDTALTLDDLATPVEYSAALENYRQGNYRQALVKFEKLRALDLPDGKTDFLYFIIAECYRSLTIHESAQSLYRNITGRFPSSSKTAPCVYRLLLYAVEDRNVPAADSLLGVFYSRYQSHSLLNAARYAVGMLYYRMERYSDAINLMTTIPPESAIHYKGQFLAAMCYIRVDKMDKALFHLEHIRKSAPDKLLASEAEVVIADIFYAQANFKTALKYYMAIPAQAPRYNHALIRAARIHLDLRNYKDAKAIAQAFIERSSQQDSYYFEMASILEQVYTQSGDNGRAARMNMEVYRQILDAKMSFEIDREIGLLKNVASRWEIIRLEALRRKDASVVKEAESQQEKIRKIEKEQRKLLYQTGFLKSRDEKDEISGLAERRYVNLLREEAATLDSSIGYHSEFLSSLENIGASDSSAKKKVVAIKSRIDSLTPLRDSARADYERLKRVAWSDEERTGIFSDEMQTKFIDWNFGRYQAKKKQLESMTAKSGGTGGKKDSLSLQAQDVVLLFGEIDHDRLAQLISQERTQLAANIESYMDFNPGNRYLPQILMRLAELYYDEAVENFGVRLKKYEAAMTSDSSSGIDFPEYDLRKAIRVYNRIIDEYPKEWIADDACFYKALALQKSGRPEEAVRVFNTLIEKYPESDYFFEANMNVGRYYFENPKVEGGKGYQLAQQAFRRILVFNEHPQFVEAVYHLGWTYYMQDMYQDAISVFKYLIEDVTLDFDPTQSAEKQMANPLLRDEAIDYLAISFNENGSVDEAVRFLDLVGNPDYAALVLKRIGELREEDGDFKGAETVYQRILKDYSWAIIAPDASISLIKVYEAANRRELAMQERVDFFTKYSRSMPWQQQIKKKSPSFLPKVDSMSISMELYVADMKFRQAEAIGDSALYEASAGHYRRLVSAYPSDPVALDGHWNLSLILETKLRQPVPAYEEYLSFSRNAIADSARKHQSALNAIAIAQSLLPADSSDEKGKLSAEAARVIEAVESYLKIFPFGPAAADVAMTMGSVYFNRNLFSSASEAFAVIIEMGSSSPRYYEAQFLTAKCLFGEEKWIPAAEAFESVYKSSPDSRQKEEAYTFMLQARYSYAKQLADAQAYEKAAIAYSDIEKKYPESNYGDIVLFSAAEAWEKLEKWQNACDNYYNLSTAYPQSKYAPDALFNAAMAYEKAEKYDTAAGTYELLAGTYPKSEKAKDGLFNLGFCYEKLGKLDKMAEANERYSRLYPEEKDVEAMLLRSAEFYARASMDDKVIRVCRNFVLRYGRNPRSVEAYFMTGKSLLNQEDTTNAILTMAQAQQHNDRLRADGLPANDYFASEAAFFAANIQMNRFERSAESIQSSRDVNADMQKATSLLTDAIRSFQKVMQYQSEKLFESGFRIGTMYEKFAQAVVSQKISEKDPIKAAVAGKDLYLTASNLFVKAKEPYGKVMELSGKVDSIGAEQKRWPDSAAVRMARVCLSAGECLAKSVEIMENAPVPKQIREEPLYFFQYNKQLAETLEPMKVMVRDYYAQVISGGEKYTIPADAVSRCRTEFSKFNCLIPMGYDSLAIKVLAANDNLPKNMPAEERDELVFQFEDMVFELQDKALFAYEDALAMSRQYKTTEGEWFEYIRNRLAVLNPEKYGRGIYKAESFKTGSRWLVRCDSAALWNLANAPSEGWIGAVRAADIDSLKIKAAPAVFISGNCSPEANLFSRAMFFAGGQPREASVRISASGPYKLFINGSLVADDTAFGRDLSTVDSVSGLEKIVTGGDNTIAASVSPSSIGGSPVLSVLLSMLVDTSVHFNSSLPRSKPVDKSAPSSPASGDSIVKAAKAVIADTSRAAPAEVSGKPATAVKPATGGGEEVLKGIAGYKSREEKAAAEQKAEQLEMQKLQIRRDQTVSRIDTVKNEIEKIKKSLSEMERGK